MDGVDLGDMITLCGVLLSAGSIIAQVRGLDKKVDSLVVKVEAHEQTDQQIHQAQGERLASLEARVA